MADVSRLLEVGSGEYIQWILKSVSSCLEGRGGTSQRTHMFLKCSNVLLFYCRCITEMKFNNLLYTMPIKRGFFALPSMSEVQRRSRLCRCVPGQGGQAMGREWETSPKVPRETLDKALLAKFRTTESMGAAAGLLLLL